MLRFTPRLPMPAGALCSAEHLQPVIPLLTSEACTNAWQEDGPVLARILAATQANSGVNFGDRQTLYRLMHHQAPERVLEIGTHIGASTLHIAAALRRTNPSGALTTVDVVDVNAPNAPWRSSGLPHPPAQMAHQLRLADRIRFVHQPSLKFMTQSRTRFNIIFLDGDHAAPSVYSELSCALRLLEPDGLIVLHDYFPRGTSLFPGRPPIMGPFEAVERAQKESPNLAVLPLGNLPWASAPGVHTTSLALVARRGTHA